MAEPKAAKRRGRQREAARNDVRIRDSAREVFIADPSAPITAVAEHAGVGISAIYKRYAGKQELLRSLCGEGLARFTAEVERGLADEPTWEALSAFMRRAVDADATALTIALAGTFEPTPELFAAGRRAGDLLARLVARAQDAGELRRDVVPEDISLLFEQLASIRVVDRDRDRELRRRGLEIALDGLRAATAGAPLSGPAPTAAELGARWR